MQLQSHWRKYYRNIPFPNRILRPYRYAGRVSKSSGFNAHKMQKYLSISRRYSNRNKRNDRDTSPKLQTVLTKLDEENLAISFDKYKFACKQVEWLGFTINSEGTKPLIKKTEAIEKLLPPKTFKQLKRFMGSIHHLTRYIPN